MATKTSVEEYLNKELPGATVKDDGKKVTVALATGNSGKLDGTSAKRDWVITGASNEKVSLIATGSGTDSISLTAASDVNINVGAGSDTIRLGKAGDVVQNITLTGGAGDKVVAIVGDLDPSYISLTSTLVGATGNDSISVGGAVLDSTIDGGAGRDTIQVTGNVKDSYILAGAGDDSVQLSSVVSGSTIDLGAGRDTLNITDAASVVTDSTIDGGDGYDAVTIKGGTSNTKISLGAGKDTLYVGTSLVDTSIYGGADADEVSITSATYSNVDLGDGNDVITLGGGGYHDVSIQTGAGKDTITVATTYAGTVSITDYDVLNDNIVAGTAGAIASANGSGNVSLTGTQVINVSKTGAYYAAQVDGTYYAWGDEDGSWIDLTSFNKSVNVNNYNGDTSDTIFGGKKDDAIFVGDNDYAYGGGGNDRLTVAVNTTQEFIGLANNAGKDTVTTFATTTTTGDAETADVLYLFENNINSLKLATDTATNNLVAKVGTGSVEFAATAPGTADTRINVKDNSGRTFDVDFVNGTTTIAAGAEKLSDIYYAGSKTASLNFSNVDSDLVVDLGNRKMTVNGTELDNTDNAVYYGSFASVTGGKDNTVLMGAADAKETLIAGAGDTTLWGGGSKSDYMQHTGTTNTATFFFTAGDGTDTVNSNNWASSDTSDVLWLGSTAIKSVKNNGTNTTVTLDDGSKVTLSGLSATDTAFKFTTDGENTQQIKVGTSGSNTWTYDEGVTYYMGGKKNTLNVSDDANIWLDGSNGKAFQNVTTVNASSNSGTVILAGAGANETLIAGTGSSSLWGGAGASNDVLQGNATGDTTFYFGKGEGADVITASNSDDKVVLYNVALSDVASADVNKSGAMEIKLHDGSSLTVNSVATGASTFQLGDGSTWKYDSSEGWKQA